MAASRRGAGAAGARRDIAAGARAREVQRPEGEGGADELDRQRRGLGLHDASCGRSSRRSSSRSSRRLRAWRSTRCSRRRCARPAAPPAILVRAPLALARRYRGGPCTHAGADARGGDGGGRRGHGRVRGAGGAARPREAAGGRGRGGEQQQTAARGDESEAHRVVGTAGARRGGRARSSLRAEENSSTGVTKALGHLRSPRLLLRRAATPPAPSAATARATTAARRRRAGRPERSTRQKSAEEVKGKRAPAAAKKGGKKGGGSDAAKAAASESKNREKNNKERTRRTTTRPHVIYEDASAADPGTASVARMLVWLPY